VWYSQACAIYIEYLLFLSISSVRSICVQYATDNLSGNNKCSFHMPVLTFQPTVNSGLAINKASSVWTVLVSWHKMHGYYGMCQHINQVCGGVQEVEGVHSGSKMTPWPSRVLQLNKPLQYIGRDWTKLLQTLTYCLQSLYKSFSAKGSRCYAGIGLQRGEPLHCSESMWQPCQANTQNRHHLNIHHTNWQSLMFNLMQTKQDRRRHAHLLRTFHFISFLVNAWWWPHSWVETSCFV
jgi:hypothetical protein